MNLPTVLGFVLVAGLAFVNAQICQPYATGNKNLKKSYDFVVVGAGSAGAVVASRLSEIESVSVLLLEAGFDEDPILHEIPIEAAFTDFDKNDWQYKMERQNATIFGDNKPEFSLPRGKILGGTSSMNFMMYLRGNKHDYDIWNEQTGENWSYEEVLPFFKKSEDFQVTPNTDSSYHGIGGYLTVSNSPFNNPLTPIILSAGAEMGMPITDVNGAKQTGLMVTQSNMRNGARCSTNKAFLKPAVNRPNLDIATGAHVTKILTEKASNGSVRATGVEFTMSGQKTVVNANKEVILSAGAVNSPQLLMLSGIGPAEHLAENKISLVANIPGVGQNLQDHIALFGIINTISGAVGSANTCPTPYDFQAGLYEWVMNKTGMLALSPVPVTGFVNTPLVDASQDWPDIQLAVLAFPTGAAGEHLARIFSVPLDVWKSYYEPKGSDTVFNVIPLMMHPKSRGSIRLRSADPMDAPIVDPNYFSDPADLETLKEGMKIALNFGKTKVFSDAEIKAMPKPYPGCERYTIGSDDHLNCLIKFSMASTFHISGTCKMSNISDPMGVVDSRLRVRNMTGLRIADTSIMPTITTGNTNAPAIMIGERAADFAKKDHGLI